MSATTRAHEERTTSRRVFVIDAFPASAFRHLGRDAVVCIDVMESSTTLVTSVAQGRRTLVAASLEEMEALAAGLDHPLLAGAAPPKGASTSSKGIVAFEIEDSPARVASLADAARTLVLFSPPGTELLVNAAAAPTVLVACFRNLAATADYLARHFRNVALLVTGLRDEYSSEDLMAAARIAEMLGRRGFEPADLRSADLTQRWSAVELALAGWGNGAARLRHLGRADDLDLILSHLDDVPLACRFEQGEVAPANLLRAAERAGGRRADGIEDPARPFVRDTRTYVR